MTPDPGSYARRGDLARMDRHLDALTSDHPRGGAVAVAGRRGLGKTALLSEVAQRARLRGWTVCRATAAIDPPLPYASLVEALEDELAGRPEVLAGLDPAAVRTLTGIFPALRTDSGTDAPPAPYDACRALRLALRLIADRPVVLLVDDLHAADPATAEAVRALLLHPPRGPVLIVVAYRPRRSGWLLDAFASDGRLTRLELTELTTAEVDRLDHGAVCAAHLALGHAACDGNPRLLRLLWSTCTGGPDCTGEPWWSLAEPTLTPPALVLLAEVTALPPGARAVARAGAVAGAEFDLELIGDILGAPREELIAGIDELVDAELVTAGDTPGRFRFGHPALRAAAYWSAPVGWRTAAHATVVSALRGRGAPVERYAEHAERIAGDPRTATAVLGAAARAVEHTDVERAIGWYGAAVRMLRGNAAADRQCSALLIALARTQVRTGRTTAARASLDEREQLLDGVPTDAHDEAEVTGIRAELAWSAGHREEARSLLGRAVERTPAHEGGAVARLRGALAGTAAWDGGAVDGDLRWCDEALMSAAGSGDSVLMTHALAATAVVRLARGGAASAAQFADEASRLADRLTDDELAGLPPALGWLGWAELLLERDERAGAHLERAVKLGHRTGHCAVLVVATAGLTRLATRQGSLDRASGYAEGITDVAGNPFLAAVAGVTRAQVAAEAGDVAAVFALTGAATVARLAGGVWWSRAQLARATAQLTGNDPAGCLDLVLRTGGGDELPALPSYERVAAFSLLARAAAALQRWDAARLHAKHAHGLAEELGMVGQLAAARLVLVEADEDRVDALQLLGRSVRDAMQVGHLAVAAHGTLLSAHHHAARGDLCAAEAELRGGAVLARQLGSPALADALVASWADVSPGPDPGVDALDVLSPRENEVADLVALGLTNQQIARKLELSPKTVETHLGRTFRKLGVFSRAEIATLVGRADAAPPHPAGTGRSHRGSASGHALLGPGARLGRRKQP